MHFIYGAIAASAAVGAFCVVLSAVVSKGIAVVSSGIKSSVNVGWHDTRFFKDINSGTQIRCIYESLTKKFGYVEKWM